MASSKKAKKIDFDPYKLLQLEPGCESGQIDRAYKKMALKWHPDKNPEQKDWAKEMFLKVYQAFEFLKDESARTAYDEGVAAKRRRAEFDEVRQASSSAQRKAHLARLHQAEAKAARVGEKRRSEQNVKDQLIEELRREGAEMMERMREEHERAQRRRESGTMTGGSRGSTAAGGGAAQQQQQSRQKLRSELDELERELFGGTVL